MADKVELPIGLSLAFDIEFRPGATEDGDGYLARLEAKTTDPYKAGWRKRVVPTLGHIPIRMITGAGFEVVEPVRES